MAKTYGPQPMSTAETLSGEAPLEYPPLHAVEDQAETQLSTHKDYLVYQEDELTDDDLVSLLHTGKMPGVRVQMVGATNE